MSAAGSSRRWPGPITRRNRCGTTMPTKPITPATETAAPVAAATSTIAMRFRRSTATPMWNASASPSTIRSSPRAMNGRPPSSSATNGAIAATLPQVAPPSEPSSQNVMSRSCRSSARKTRNPIPALASAPIAMPASSSVAIEVRPERVARR